MHGTIFKKWPRAAPETSRSKFAGWRETIYQDFSPRGCRSFRALTWLNRQDGRTGKSFCSVRAMGEWESSPDMQLVTTLGTLRNKHTPRRYERPVAACPRPLLCTGWVFTVHPQWGTTASAVQGVNWCIRGRDGCVLSDLNGSFCIRPTSAH